MTNAKKLSLRGGGTDCSCPLKQMNDELYKADLVVIVSDNESWAGYNSSNTWRGDTNVSTEWRKFRKRNPKAKLVLIDILPGRTTQVADDHSVLNVGGFSDQVFNVINGFMQEQNHWVEAVRKVKI